MLFRSPILEYNAQKDVECQVKGGGLNTIRCVSAFTDQPTGSLFCGILLFCQPDFCELVGALDTYRELRKV